MARVRSRRDVPPDRNAATRPDTAGTDVWWLIDRSTAGADSIVLNTNELPPGTAHRLHRHPYAEQAVFVVAGRGVHLTESGGVEVVAGDAVHVPAGEWHGFANPHQRVCTILSIYGGVGDRSEAGYESHPDPPPIAGIDGQDRKD
jgi:quercetin dioxygenase-like cupin family protein